MTATQDAAPGSPLDILLVSAYPEDWLQITQILRPAFPDVQVRQITDEKQLAVTISRGGFNLALVDSNLPWIDSQSVVRAIHVGFPDCPVVMIAEIEHEECLAESVQAGLESYVLRVSGQLVCLSAAMKLALEKSWERQARQEADKLELEQARLALQESEVRFRTIVEQSPLSIQVMTPDGWTSLVNRAWEELWGVTAADVQNYNMLQDEQAQNLGMMPYVKRGFEGEAVSMPPVAYHTPETLKTGRKRWFQAHIYPVKGKRDEIRNVIMVYEDITERQWATENLQKLSTELMNAQETERKRISQELHDELGQALTAMRLNLAALEKDLASDLPPNRDKLTETSLLVDETLEHVRELSHALRPTMLDELGLVPTLRWYTNRYAERLGIAVQFEALDLEDRLRVEIETALYRMVQEALTNIAKHAHARHVHLRLLRQASTVTAAIEDDGVGFDAHRHLAPDGLGWGTGLVGMRERAAQCGGTLTIRSSPNHGTRLFLELPLGPLSSGGKT
jgi:PAS domain S-box-containing protein